MDISYNPSVARTTGKLTALTVAHVAKQAGFYPDGDGLYLRVTNGGASWVYRYMLAGRARYMGLGPLKLYGLAEARDRLLEAKRMRHNGVDPIDAKREAKAQALLEAAKGITFKDAAASYIASHSKAWKGAKVEALWKATLATYAEPVLGALAVKDIDTNLVVKVLEPIWNEKPETAGRVRQRIEAILDWAKVRGYREGENPARWKGHLEVLLPARSKIRRVAHHPALPYDEIGDFMAALRAQEGTAARALELLILTAARTTEILNAPWNEFDLDGSVWTVPAERMRKSGKQHRVPLSDEARAILNEAKRKRDALDEESRPTLVFPGARRDKPLSNMAFLMLLRRLGRGDITAHGFRSTFRDWAAERTNFPNEVAEMALAHTVPDDVEGAYRRGDLFEKRQRLMAAWARFCAQGKRDKAQVVPLRQSG